MENWKAIKNYEGLYEVSDLGRVRSLDRMVAVPHGGQRLAKGQVLKPKQHRDGYLCVFLSKKQKQICPMIHKLVLEAFVGQTTDWLIYDGIPLRQIIETRKNMELQLAEPK